MQRIMYIDQDVIDNLETCTPGAPDTRLVDAVREALAAIRPDLQEIIRERFYDGRTIREIAGKRSIDQNEARVLLYEAQRQLRRLLGDFAQKRWGIQPSICRICCHPQVDLIERILTSKTDDESWGRICQRLKDAAGEHFRHPQVLIAHLKHMREMRLNSEVANGNG